MARPAEGGADRPRPPLEAPTRPVSEAHRAGQPRRGKSAFQIGEIAQAPCFVACRWLRIAFGARACRLRGPRGAGASDGGGVLGAYRPRCLQRTRGKHGGSGRPQRRPARFLGGSAAKRDFPLSNLKTFLPGNKIEIAAEAQAERIRREAKGEADGILAKYQAEAEGVRKLLESKAEGYRKLVESVGGDAQAAHKDKMTRKMAQFVFISFLL